MKRLIFILVTLTLMLSLTVGVSADYKFSPDRVTVGPVIEVTPKGVEYFGSVSNGRNVVLPIGTLVLSDSMNESFPDRSTLNASALATLRKADAKLARAYRQLANADSIFDLFGTERLDPKKDYAVTALFDLTPVNEGIKIVERAFRDCGELTVKLQVDVPTDREFYFAIQCTEEWTILEDDQVEVLGNGEVALTFYELCPIVLIEEIKDDPGPTPEPTPPSYIIPIIIIVVLLVAILIVCVLIYHRKCCRCRCK